MAPRWSTSAFLVGCLAVLSACSGTSTGSGAPPDARVDAPAADAPREDVPTMDAPAMDAPASDTPPTDVPPVDAPSDIARDAPLDAPADALDAALCAMGLTQCAADGGFVCVDLQTDRNHCGGCGRTCCAGTACFGGSCPLGCAAGNVRCGCVCVDPQSDPRNCGACGNACPAGDFCQWGVCMTPVRDAGPDAPTSCATVTETPAPSGVCDGRGRIACQNWAASMLDGGVAFATCVSTPVGCMRADVCDDIADTSTCRCGAAPACGPGQVCATAPGASAPSCRCIVTR